jgi:hypothetical protein
MMKSKRRSEVLYAWVLSSVHRMCGRVQEKNVEDVVYTVIGGATHLQWLIAECRKKSTINTTQRVKAANAASTWLQ